MKVTRSLHWLVYFRLYPRWGTDTQKHGHAEMRKSLASGNGSRLGHSNDLAEGPIRIWRRWKGNMSFSKMSIGLWGSWSFHIYESYLVFNVVSKCSSNMCRDWSIPASSRSWMKLSYNQLAVGLEAGCRLRREKRSFNLSSRSFWWAFHKRRITERVMISAFGMNHFVPSGSITTTEWEDADSCAGVKSRVARMRPRSSSDIFSIDAVTHISFHSQLSSDMQAQKQVRADGPYWE